MSRGELERYRQAVYAFNRRDRVAWLVVGYLAVVNICPVIRRVPKATGLDVVWYQLVANMDAWEEQHSRLSSWSMPETRRSGTDRSEVMGKSSGAAIAWTYRHVVTFRDGKIVRSEWFADRAEALEAAGLEE